MRPVQRGNKRKKVEPVQTDFTDDVISESNAANEGAQGKRKRERERRTGE